MKKNLISIAFLLFVTALVFPVNNVSAWAWQDIFKIENKEVKKEEIFQLSDQEVELAQEKYNYWENAIAENSIKKTKENEFNFELTEEEANYLLEYHINKSKDPYFCKASLDFKEDFITLDAYVLKPLNGNVSLDFIITKENDVLNIEILKATYKGIHVPGFFLNRPLNNILDNFFTTVCFDNSCENINFILTNNSIKLDLNGVF